MIRWFFFFSFFVFTKFTFALDALGGYISWKCNGTGRYIFELTLYRDCNGADLSSNVEIISVWNHPTVTQIPVNFVTRVNLTPTCSPVVGSPEALNCGSGANAGNGIGAIEKIIYQSDVLDLDGLPPVEGWHFTFETLTRRASISNLILPDQYGMTLTSTMFENSPIQTNCMDNSPKILNDPNFINCNAMDYNFLQLVTDDDLDFLQFKMATPLKNNISGAAFQPGINPTAVDYVNNINANLPIPGQSFNVSNSDFSISANKGDLNFKTQTNGEFIVKFEIESFRNGKKNASVGVELTIFVIDCDNQNNAPVVAGPFGGLYELSVTAGQLVNFTIASTDNELLQDGSPQTNLITPTGSMFGTNFSDPNGGCHILPCATLNPLPLIAMNQGASTDFSWVTSCNHLRNQYGNEFDSVSYDFIFKFQDNYCQVPKTTYKRVTISIETDTEVEPALIDCIQTLPTGELLITRTDPPNPNNVPVIYELNCIQTGTVNIMPTTTITIPTSGNLESYYIKTITGNPCTVSLIGDTVSNIILSISPNPDSSVATLTWNSPYFSSNDREGYYSILREFPIGVWTEIAQVDFGTNRFNDTVDICNAFLNYTVIFNKIGCSFFSNIVGAQLQDGNIPDLPIISSVSINPLTGLVEVVWNENPKKDTYGYIIYNRDENDFSVDIDTVYGRLNTNTEYDLDTDLEALTFSVAAFDSCLTDIGTFYSTTGKAPEHTTMFLTNTYDICAKEVTLTWSPYIGWDSIKEYEILAKVDGSTFEIIGSTLENQFKYTVDLLRNYEFVILAKNGVDIFESYSNISKRFSLSPTRPEFHYTRSVTVENEQIEIQHYIENNSGVKDIIIQKLDEDNEFVDLITLPVTSANMNYLDVDVTTNLKTYTYRVILIDSCGNYADTSNVSTSILLNVESDDLNLVNFLNWTAYKGFNGSILYYNVYRGFEGNFSSFPIAKVPANKLYYYDTISDLVNFNGQICYYVEAFEAMNIYLLQDSAKSNVVCAVFNPQIYIPNTFTPNEDEFNQFFKPELSLNEVTSYELIVMNRWGEKVFESQAINFAWNGTNKFTNQSCPQGTYFYILKVKNGENQEVTKKGHVNLIR